MIYSKIFLALVLLFGVDRTFSLESNFIELVKNSTLVHHKQTNTVWEYLGTYAQTGDTVNFILEISVFQFMCDVFPVSIAYAMKVCTQYRTRLLENGSVCRLNELAEAHVGQRQKRQLEEIALGSAAAYGAYKIIGDLFGGKNDEIIDRLNQGENFQNHQEKLNDALVTLILALEDNNLVMLKSFKQLFDSVNETRSFIYNLLKVSIRKQRTFTG
ncbi:unnamed protein product [Adineta ricciae]|uniref:Uncharacterized protein n=1 Tax=Adineta ricciae TaxID=249248 RepID=A0A815V9X5_ADIRI|nr:unnamed protein product [Adineta ricciae]CAF1529337.1 unnamed protein product [Adineta ricciae]